MNNPVRIQQIVDQVAQSLQRLATGWKFRGSNPGWAEIFRTCPDPPWGPPSLLYKQYQVFPGCKERPGRDADPSHPSSALVMKEQSYTSTPPIGHTACTEPQFLYRGDLYLLPFIRQNKRKPCKQTTSKCYCIFVGNDILFALNNSWDIIVYTK